MSPVSRRTLLSTGASGLLAMLAGCSFPNGGRQQIPVQLRNETGTAHAFAVRVRHLDEALLEASTTVEAGGSASFRFENPDSREAVTVVATIDETQATEKHVDIGPGTGTEFIRVVVDEAGQLWIEVAVE